MADHCVLWLWKWEVLFIRLKIKEREVKHKFVSLLADCDVKKLYSKDPKTGHPNTRFVGIP